MLSTVALITTRLHRLEASPAPLAGELDEALGAGRRRVGSAPLADVHRRRRLSIRVGNLIELHVPPNRAGGQPCGGAVQRAEVQERFVSSLGQRQLELGAQAHAPAETTWTSWFASASMAMPSQDSYAEDRRVSASAGNRLDRRDGARRCPSSRRASCAIRPGADRRCPGRVVELRVPAVHLHVDERRARGLAVQELTTASGHIERRAAAPAGDDDAIGCATSASAHSAMLGRHTVLSTSFEGPLEQLANGLPGKGQVPRDPFAGAVRVVAVSRSR